MSTVPFSEFGAPISLEYRELVGASVGFPTTRSQSRFGRRYLLFFDLFLIWLCAGIAHLVFSFSLRLERGHEIALPFNSGLWGLILLFSVLVVLFANNNGLYQRIWQRRIEEEIKCLGESVASASLVLAASIYLETVRIGSIFTAGITIALSWIVLLAWRRFLHAQAIPGLTEKRNILIVGRGRAALALQAHLDQNPEFGYVVKGFIERRRMNRKNLGEQEDGTVQFLGDVSDLPTLIREHFIDEIFICVPSDQRLVMDIATCTLDWRIQLRILPDFYEGLAITSPVEYVGQLLTINEEKSRIPSLGLIFKRFVDIAASSLLLFLLFPVISVVALLVKLDSKGPVFYRSFRIGRKGEAFLCYKFRTMVANADAIKDSLRHLNERESVTFKISSDPRITPLGKFLRKYSIDELPQLWNVFLGHLSLVGPRPHPLEDFLRYALEHRRRLEAKPGITGLWQVTARRDPSFEKNVALDIEYIQNWSFWLDCQILWKTVGVVLAGTGQ